MRNILIILCLALSACAGAAPPTATGPAAASWPSGVDHRAIESTGLPWERGAPRLDADLWRASTRAEVLAALDRAPETRPALEAWPALRPLVTGALTTPIDLDFLADGARAPAPGRDLLTARVEALLALGEAARAATLYGALDAGPYGDRLAMAGVAALVKSGQGPLACVETAAAAAGAAADPFWDDMRSRCAPGTRAPLPSSGPKKPPAVTIADPSGPPSLVQVRGAFARAALAGQPLPEAWVAALDALEVPRSPRGRRIYAILQATASIAAGQAEGASRLEAARAALADDPDGAALFAARVAPVLGALRPQPPAEVKKKSKDDKKKPNGGQNYYENIFSLTEGSAYVMTDPAARESLHAAVESQSAGRTALAAALLLAGQEPGPAAPAVVAEVVGALATLGIATTAERVAEQAVLAAAQGL